ncbi:MAG: RNA polymerase subunit sigma-70 [Hyphomicrobium sp.]|nr:MAG: RNA polymerase subunit sigma-70 [Hyphomicrobium sp.]PPD00373.1 MAG: RNA polymerase subunit sigma-70 [Hyphomicrobium sp.]
MTGSETELRLQIVALLPRLRRFAFALTGRQDEADDLVQSACLKALDRLSQYEVGTRLDSWMFKIVQTTFLDEVRSRSRRAKDTVVNEDINAVGFDARIHERTEARADLAIIRAKINELPAEQRELLALVVVDGMSYQSAAEVLDVPIGTVMSRLARARKKLASALQDAAVHAI